MSLINKMLQDLEARRAPAEVTGPFGGQVRATPVRHPVRLGGRAGLMSVVVLVAVLAWWAGWQSAGSALPAYPAAPLIASGMHSGESATYSATPVGTSEKENKASDPAATPPAEIGLPGKQPRSAMLALAQSAPMTVAGAAENGAGTAPPSPLQQPMTEQAATPATPPVVGTKPAMQSVQEEEPRRAVAASLQAVLPVKQPSAQSAQQLAANAYSRATVLIPQSRMAEARRSLEQALEFDASHAEARMLLVSLLLHQGDMNSALAQLHQGLALDAAQVRMAMTLARLQIENNELKAAIATLENSLPYAQAQADYHQFLAALLQRDARHAQAIVHYRLALQAAPDRGLWWMGLGLSLQAEQHSPEARIAFEHARRDPSLSAPMLAFISQKLEELQ